MLDLTSKDIANMIRMRYGPPDHVTLFEVPDGTGMYTNRHIDAAVFSLWPSKGLTRAAIEIKVSRGDFIRELQNPAKHKWCQECFHEFWFAGPKEVFLVDELPVGAGLMVPHGDKLVIKKHAVRNPVPKLDDSLLAAFMRAAAKEIEIEAKRGEKEILENSGDYKKAKIYQAAVDKYCGMRHALGSLNEYEDVDGIVGVIEKAAGKNLFEQDRDHFLEVTGKFQRDMAEFFMLFAEIAHRNLIERDKLGRYIIGQWGGIDEHTFEALRASTKDPKNQDYKAKYAAAVELIMAWAGENHV